MDFRVRREHERERVARRLLLLARHEAQATVQRVGLGGFRVRILLRMRGRAHELLADLEAVVLLVHVML